MTTPCVTTFEWRHPDSICTRSQLSETICLQKSLGGEGSRVYCGLCLIGLTRYFFGGQFSNLVAFSSNLVETTMRCFFAIFLRSSIFRINIAIFSDHIFYCYSTFRWGEYKLHNILLLQSCSVALIALIWIFIPTSRSFKSARWRLAFLVAYWKWVSPCSEINSDRFRMAALRVWHILENYSLNSVHLFPSGTTRVFAFVNVFLHGADIIQPKYMTQL